MDDGTARRPGTVLRELLRERCLLPYRRFCREYDKVAHLLDAGLVGTYPSESTYKRWLSGRISGVPRSDASAVLEAMFPGRTVGELFAPHTAGGGPEVERLSRIVAGQISTDRTALDASADVLADIRHLEDVTGPLGVMRITRSQHAVVTQLARNASGDVRGAAIGLLSELEQYLGWLHMAPTVERWDESRRHLDRAATLALEADDPMRLSTALSFAADRHLRIDEQRPAVALNEAASRDARVHVSLRTFNAFHRAAILARGGSRFDVVTALCDADRLTELLPPPHELPSSGYWYTESFFHGERAFVLQELGDHREARRLADKAIAAIPAQWTNDEWSDRRRAHPALPLPGDRGRPTRVRMSA